MNNSHFGRICVDSSCLSIEKADAYQRCNSGISVLRISSNTGLAQNTIKNKKTGFIKKPPLKPSRDKHDAGAEMVGAALSHKRRRQTLLRNRNRAI